MKKVIVVGSGISGLSISRMLTERYDVRVLEQSDKPGGLIKCERIDGNLFHKVGGHVFNSKNELVLEWFWKHFNRDHEFRKANRNAKILLNNNLIGYPLENYLYQLPEDQLRQVINELLKLLSSGKKQVGFYNNFKDFLIGSFGQHLYNIYFGPYNSKIWNTDISKVPLEWLDGKLPMPEIKEVIINNILKREESKMVHSTFYYPKIDGSQFIVNRLADQLKISLSTPVLSIRQGTNDRLIVNNTIDADTVVYSGDVRKLSNIIDIEDPYLRELLRSVEGLLSNGTSNVLCETDENDISWLYLPDENLKAHRIIYTGNFSSTNNDGGIRKTCVVEFSGKQDRTLILEELKRLPGNLTPLAFNYEPNSYIIQEAGTRNQIAELKTVLEKYNIHLLGRFAEWEYNNMDKCIEAAMLLNEKIG